MNIISANACEIQYRHSHLHGSTNINTSAWWRLMLAIRKCIGSLWRNLDGIWLISLIITGFILPFLFRGSAQRVWSKLSDIVKSDVASIIIYIPISTNFQNGYIFTIRRINNENKDITRKTIVLKNNSYKI